MFMKYGKSSRATFNVVACHVLDTPGLKVFLIAFSVSVSEIFFENMLAKSFKIGVKNPSALAGQIRKLKNGASRIKVWGVI